MDPHKYPGSGLYWTRHLKEHGFDYNTEVLKEGMETPSLTEKNYTGGSRGIYIPRKHTVDSYRGQQRKAQKRRNIKKFNKR